MGRRQSHQQENIALAVSFDADANSSGQVLTVSNVPELARYLMEGVSDNLDWQDEYDLSETDIEFKQKNAERKTRFIDEVSRSIPTINDISKITVLREYEAWGEGAELIAENDYELCELAQEVNDAVGADKKKALSKMLDYIRSARIHAYGMRFGEGMVVRYSWDGDENDLIRLANRLCSDLCADFYRGKEYREIDVRNQSVMSDAVYDLTAD